MLYRDFKNKLGSLVIFDVNQGKYVKRCDVFRKHRGAAGMLLQIVSGNHAYYELREARRRGRPSTRVTAEGCAEAVAARRVVNRVAIVPASVLPDPPEPFGVVRQDYTLDPPMGMYRIDKKKAREWKKKRAQMGKANY